MPVLFMTYGLPASGKSTWSKNKIKEEINKTKRVNKDDLRNMVDNGQYSKENEKIILSLRDLLLKKCLAHGNDVICDDLNITLSHHVRLREIANDMDSTLVLVDFTDISLDECIARDYVREDGVGEKVIRFNNGYLNKHEIDLDLFDDIITPDFLDEENFDGLFIKYQKIDQDKTLPKTIICDIDGTIALMVDRGPYEQFKCINDAVNTPVFNMLNIYKEQGFLIILLSGRDSYHRPMTEKWLEINNVPYDHLYMRIVNDRRKDTIVKEELFNEHIRGRYYIECILEDRNQIVNLWRSLGFSCFQVNYGDF